MPFEALDDAALLEQLAIIEARSNFWKYRQFIQGPKFKRAWWPRSVALALDEFARDFLAGKKPKLILEAPPQHGKSFTVIDLISYIAGHNPDVKTIYASFSDRLGIRANLRLQRTFDSKIYQKLFPNTNINKSNVVTISNQYLRNREILEYVGREGSFRNTTVNGAVTGEGLDFGVIDDPIKGRDAANSETIRDKTWDWFTDDFFTRFSEEAALLAILTRWHIDDVIGRMIIQDPTIKVLRYPAIAEVNEEFRKAGEPLFPEHKSLGFLLERKKIMSPANWEALYQQNPIIPGGSTFPRSKWQFEDREPMPYHIVKRVRYWDKAGTQGGGAYTAGVKMYLLKDGRFCIVDCVREQLNAFNREMTIKATAIMDGLDCEVWVEQEPGSGGLESAQRTVLNLVGFAAFMDKVTGAKESRAMPYSAQQQAGNVIMVRGAWNKAFLDEHDYFPNGPYKDQVDASAGAFMKVRPVGSEAGVW